MSLATGITQHELVAENIAPGRYYSSSRSIRRTKTTRTGCTGRSLALSRLWSRPADER